ncbi:MAG: hydroxymethylglutaryl-CoA lyase [Thermomicrobiales bacterium]
MATQVDPNAVRIVEVAPRDGLQNYERPFATEVKIAFIDALSQSGLTAIEATSFVNPKAVPLMADALEVMQGIDRVPGVRYLVLTPNEKGFDRAISAGVDSVAVFASASETFSQRNINCTIAESLARFAPIYARAKADGIWVRGYISMAFACPFEGDIAPTATANLAQELLEMGSDEICLADTIGAATIEQTIAVLETTLRSIPAERLALHMHDTYGLAVHNIGVAYDHGVRVFDSAAGGLGGCPFAPGAAGNLATERLIAYLDERGIPHGVDSAVVHEAVEALLASPAA